MPLGLGALVPRVSDEEAPTALLRHPKTVSGWMVGECGLTNITEGVTGGQFRCSLNMLGGMSSFI